MAFDPKGFYDFAQWLIAQKEDEPIFRTAIGRVYYAAHHIAKAKCVQKLNLTVTGFGDDHGRVIKHLKGLGRFRQRGEELDSLRTLREHADYHLDASVTTGNQEHCLFCKKLRAANSSDIVVTSFHLNEAMVLAKKCIPLLEKI